MLRNCKVCNKQFCYYPSRKNVKYCSTSCYFNRNGIKKKVLCKICHKSFFKTPSKIKKSKRHFCSFNCYIKAQKTLPSPLSNKIIKKCLVCHKNFYTIPAKVKVGKGKYCSKKCYLIEHCKDTWPIKICLGCDKEFKSPRYMNKVCCSLSCNAKLMIKLHGSYGSEIRRCLQCNKEFLVKQSRLKKKQGKFCCKKCWHVWMSVNRLGEKSTNWKGGITNLYKKIRSLMLYRQWQRLIRERDKICIFCFNKKNLETDHYPKSFSQIIKEYNIKSTEQAIKCQELWNINNGRLLCDTCHRQTETYAYKSFKQYVR